MVCEGGSLAPGRSPKGNNSLPVPHLPCHRRLCSMLDGLRSGHPMSEDHRRKTRRPVHPPETHHSCHPCLSGWARNRSRRIVSVHSLVGGHRHCRKFNTRLSAADFARTPLKLQIFVCSVAIGPLKFGFESMSRLGFRAGFWALFRRRKRKADGPNTCISEPSGRDSATEVSQSSFFPSQLHELHERRCSGMVF